VRRALRELSASFVRADVLVLVYHVVRSRARFAAQMALLMEHGYRVVSLREFTDWLDGRLVVRSRTALLTFDGGYCEQLEHAVPILESLRCQATFFPISLALENPAVGMGRRDLEALTTAGHAIGCHTHTHPDLTQISPHKLHDEVTDSKRRLEDALGGEVIAFCYPYGTRNSHVVQAVREAGFKMAFTIDLGGVSQGDDRFQLRRAAVLGEPSATEFSAFVRGVPFVSGSLLAWWKIRERLLD